MITSLPKFAEKEIQELRELTILKHLVCGLLKEALADQSWKMENVSKERDAMDWLMDDETMRQGEEVSKEEEKFT